MDVWIAFNDTLAIVIWPVVVVVLVCSLRDRIGGVRKIETPFGSVELVERSKRDFAKQIDAAAAESGPAITAGADATPQADLEILVKAAARAGYLVAASRTFSSIPTPVIVWEEGWPRILEWEESVEAAPPSVAPFQPADSTSALAEVPDVIRRIRRQQLG